MEAIASIESFHRANDRYGTILNLYKIGKTLFIKYSFIKIIKGITRSMNLNKNDAVFTSSISKIVVLATIIVILINPMKSCSVSSQGVLKVTTVLIPINP